MLSRAYIAHRDAMTPRMWPLALGAGVVDFAATFAAMRVVPDWAAIPATLVLIVAGVALGVSGVALRYRLWTRRHPLRPCGPGCYLHFSAHLDAQSERQREVARWQ